MKTKRLTGFSCKAMTAAMAFCPVPGICLYGFRGRRIGKPLFRWNIPATDRTLPRLFSQPLKRQRRVNGPVTLQFEEGKEYEVWPETSYHTTGYYVSNSATQGENPQGERWSVILLKDMEDVTH